MSLRDQAKQSLPRVLRTSFSQANSLDLEKEQFEREQLNAVTKALSILETPVKEKHVRTIIIGTHKTKSSNFLWNLVSSRAPLHGNPIVCWKFCCILHKVLREGHPRTVTEAARHIGLLEDLGKLWGHLKEGYGRLINVYCKLLVRKLQFHEKNPKFPGNLAMDKDALIKAGNNDAGNFYEMCIDFLDYLEELLNLEKSIFDSLDMSKANSMTSSGQCRLNSLIACIQDSVHLYDYSVKIIFLLHQHLPPDTLSGHTSRFLVLFSRLRKFYNTCSNLQYFKNLVQVPSLPDQPPNFLVAANLRDHVTPVAVVPEQTEEPELDTSDSNAGLDERDRYIDQLLAEVETLQIKVTQLEDEKRRVENMFSDAQDRVNYERSISERLQAEVGAAQTELAALTAMVREQQQMQEQDKSRSIEEKFNKLKEVYQKLREEHIALLRKKAEVDKQLAGSNISRDEALSTKDSLEKKMKEMVDKLTVAKAELSDSKQEQDIQIHNMQASLASLQSKVSAGEDTIRSREDKEREVETRLLEIETELTNTKLKLSDAEQNKHNLEEEIVDLTWKLKQLETSGEEANLKMEEYALSARSQAQQLTDLGSELNLCRKKEVDCLLSSLRTAVGMLEAVTAVEDIDSISCSVQTLKTVCQRCCDLLNQDWPNQTDLQISVINRLCHGMCLGWGLSRGVANTSPDIELTTGLIDKADTLRRDGIRFFAGLMESSNPNSSEVGGLLRLLEDLVRLSDQVGMKLGEEVDLADLVSLEISAMDAAIEDAARKMEELLAASRAKDSGLKLEVNEKMLDSCTSLVQAIRILVQKSKILQREILREKGAAGGSEKDFYRKNSRWTEGLISAAKAVGLGAKLLVDAADKVVLGSGRFEEIMAASQEISASTAQLVIASRVKAREGSDSFDKLKDASRDVTKATGTVVATAKSCATETEEGELLDFSKLSAHQTKTMEMEAQVHLLKLEREVELARTKLGALRKSLYKESTN